MRGPPGKRVSRNTVLPEGAAANAERSCPGTPGLPAPAAGSVVGRLGQTGRLGLAAYRGRPGRCAPGLRSSGRVGLPALEANPQAGGTVRPNTSSGLAGGGPPMAGHVCRSVSVGQKSARVGAEADGARSKATGFVVPEAGRGPSWQSPARPGPAPAALGSVAREPVKRATKVSEISPGQVSRGGPTSPEAARPPPLEAHVSENRVSEIVRKVACKHGVKCKHRDEGGSPDSGGVSPSPRCFFWWSWYTS